MASAYKCDRCGELYPDEARDFGIYLCDKDLCPKCQEQLDAWFADPDKAVVSFVEIDDNGYKHKQNPSLFCQNFHSREETNE